MFKNLLIYVKYPSVAGIIACVWVGSLVMIVFDRDLPILTMTTLNTLLSIFIASIGFRVDKK